MPQEMRFSLFASLWIVCLACGSASSREGACRQEDEFQRMGDFETETEAEEIEELIRGLAIAPPTRVHDGGSNSATPESWPQRLPLPSPPILPIPQPLPPGLPMLNPPFMYPGHVLGPWPFLFFMPAAPFYLLVPAPWPLYMPMEGQLLPLVPWPGSLPLRVPMHTPAHAHRRARVPRREHLRGRGRRGQRPPAL